MGLCCSANTDNTLDREIYQQLEDDDRRNSSAVAVLYGIQGSGKTSIMKQIDYIYNEGKNIHKITSNAIVDIRNVCIDNIVALCDIADDHKSIQLLDQLSIKNDNDLKNIRDIISSIWNTQHIKIKYSLRHFYAEEYDEMDDNMDYFWDKIDQIMDINYSPSIYDLIKYKTIKHSIFQIDNVGQFQYQLIDIGTFNNETELYHRKHFNIFNYADYIFFTVSLNSYCIYHDSINQMHESIQYFDEVINSESFKDATTVFLLFTKLDLFKDCLKRGISLKTCFPEYDGKEYSNIKLPLIASNITRQFEVESGKLIPIEIVELVEKYVAVINNDYGMTDNQFFQHCYEESITYIKNIYKEQDNYSNTIYSKPIFGFILNTMDADCFEKVFCDINTIIINYSLERTS